MDGSGTSYEWRDARLPLDWTDPTAPPPPSPSPPPRRARRWVVPVAAGLVGAALALGGVWLTGWPGTGGETRTTIVERVVTEIANPQPVDVETLAAAVAMRVVPSIVTIQVGGATPGTGSGVVYDAANGYIVTNDHVAGGQTDLTVVLSDGRTYEARLVGSDTLTDLAVVEIDASALTPIEIGSTDDLVVGSTAVAIGNPLGLQGGPSVTVGIVSAFDRSVAARASSQEALAGMLQTDAPITRGSSGGALVDGQGRLIGITTAVAVSDLGAEGLGFATPVEVVRRVADAIIATGTVTHGFLGIQGETAYELALDGGQEPVGVRVSRLLDDPAAADAGIREGDVITTIDGHPVRTMQLLISRLRRYSAGDRAVIDFVRDGAGLTVTVTLGERPAEPS